MLHRATTGQVPQKTRSTAGHDKVIQHPDVDQGQRLLQRLRQQLVGPARFSDTRGMVVRENRCGCVILQHELHDLPRIDRRLRQRSAKAFVHAQQPILGIEREHDERLVLATAKMPMQVVADGFGRAETILPTQLLQRRAFCTLGRRIEEPALLGVELARQLEQQRKPAFALQQQSIRVLAKERQQQFLQ